MLVPPTSLTKLYKQIVPNKKTVYEDRELKKVDNVKDFKRTSEVHIGKNAFKAGKREQIMKIYNKSKTANPLAFIFGLLIIFVVCIFI